MDELLEVAAAATAAATAAFVCAVRCVWNWNCAIACWYRIAFGTCCCCRAIGPPTPPPPRLGWPNEEPKGCGCDWGGCGCGCAPGVKMGGAF